MLLINFEKNIFKIKYLNDIIKLKLLNLFTNKYYKINQKTLLIDFL